MKQTTVVCLTPSNKIVAMLSDGKTFVQTKFEGFQITNNLIFRLCFDQLIGTEIQCSYNKNEKTLRYLNENFFCTLLVSGALTVNRKELDESKFYTSQLKNKFLQITVSENLKDHSKSPILLNDKEHSFILKDLIRKKTSVSAQIECLSEDLLIRFEYDGRNAFLKCKIENCRHYFQLFPQVAFWESKFLPNKFEVKIVSQKYNLSQKNSQVFVTLPEKTLEHFLKQGWVALNPKNCNKNSRDSFTNFSKIQSESIKKLSGIYSKKSEILSFIYTKNNYVGVVTNIIEGYIYEIMALKTEQTSKIQLPMVICPIGNEPGSFQSREFIRKQLIGKEVNVYLHKEDGLNITGNIVRIEDWKDVQSLLLENGYAYLREEFKNSVLGQKYSELEFKAKEKLKGIHKKNIENRRFEDLTRPPVNKNQMELYLQRRMEILRRLSKVEEVVIQKIINPLTYKIRIDSMSIQLNIKLEGIVQTQLNPNLKEYFEIKQASQKFLDRNLLQRTMQASIFDYDEETNSFIGTLSTENGKTDLQEILIKNSFVYADKQNRVSKYINLENEAKKGNKHIWQQKLLGLQPSSELDKENCCFEGKFSWVQSTNVAFVHPKDNFDTLDKLQQKIRKANLPKLPSEKVRIGAWCAAFYEGQLYRAAIKSMKDQNATVQFLDWGNQEIVKVNTLKELPEELLYIPRQCTQVNLNLLKGPNNKKSMQKMRDTMFDRGMYVFEKVNGIIKAKPLGTKPKYVEKH